MACNFIKRETLEQVFFCEFDEIFKNTLFNEHLWWLLLYSENKIQKNVDISWSANQWISFYKIRTSAKKELRDRL